jgi:hypothetical protein
MKRLLEKVYSRLMGFDPGLIRLEKGAVAVLSFLSAWIIIRQILQIWPGQLDPTERVKLALFAPVLSLICSLIINDLQCTDRRNNVLLSILPIAGVLASFTLLPRISWLYGLILLGLFFFSYYFRRYGVRSGEMFLLATAAFYFSSLLNVTFEILPWFLAAALTGILSVYLWRFVLIPHNTERNLRRTTDAFYHQASLIVSEIIIMIDGNSFHNPKKLQRMLNSFSRGRKVLENEIEALSPSVWNQAWLNRLRIDYYNSEQGLNLMVQSTSALAGQGQVPTDLLQKPPEFGLMLHFHRWKRLSLPWHWNIILWPGPKILSCN